MTREHMALRLLAIIAAFALAAAAGWWFIGNGFADTRWLDPAVVSGAAAVDAAPAVGAGSADAAAPAAGDDAFGGGLGPDAAATAPAAPVEAAPSVTAAPDATALDVVRENAAARFTRALVSGAGVGALIALGWMLAANARAPGVQGPGAARAMAGAWFGGLVVFLVSLGLIGWRALADPAVAGQVGTGGQWTLCLVIVALLLLAYWLATVFATPRVLRPSVPAGNLIP